MVSRFGRLAEKGWGIVVCDLQASYDRISIQGTCVVCLCLCEITPPPRGELTMRDLALVNHRMQDPIPNQSRPPTQSRLHWQHRRRDVGNQSAFA